ncbi:pilus assembly protein TadG-related protein [Nocardia sp. N13]|uniref:pilus assembly protein TadG-related protein n=1 Tax=Nocardioides sp. N13(2025) TaxID=3453405 RepID=UPI003F75DB9D
MRFSACRDESGATMVLVALVTTALLGMLAFTADLGMAYANKRQLQTAADAASLGAAGVFASSQKYACAEVLTDKSAAANGEASTKVIQNTPGTGNASLTTYSATCTTKGIEVTATVGGTSANFFGKVLGRSSDYQVERSATAVVEPSTGGTAVRPLAICSGDLPSPISAGTPFSIRLPGEGTAPPGSCPIPPNAGNWWTLDCPDEGSDDGSVGNGNGNSALVEQIRDGCPKPVSIVPNQLDVNGNYVSPSALNTVLASACPSVSTSAPYQCLGGDPGQPDAGQVENSWKYLIDNRVQALIPVFCAPSQCDHSSVTGTGTNAVFPVHKFVGVTVCGYHFGKQPNKRYRATLSAPDVCSPASSQLDQLENNATDESVYLVVVFLNAQTSGSTLPAACAVGGTCDTGVRQVRLVR